MDIESTKITLDGFHIVIEMDSWRIWVLGKGQELWEE